MQAKRFLSTFILSCILMSFTSTPKAQAGVVIGLASTAVYAVGMHKASARNSPTPSEYKTGLIMTFSGLGGMIVGTTVFAAGVFTVNPMLMVLSEDGSLPQDELEEIFMERYPFIGDREAYSELASTFKSAAESQKPDKDGKKFVSIPEEKIESITEHLILKEEDKTQLINELK